MRRATVVLAFLTSALSFLVLGAFGSMLLFVENSGERATGALLVSCGTMAFACASVLVFARAEKFRETTWRAGAIAAGIIGAMPVAGLSAAALRFSGLPVGSAIPLADWSIFAGGVVLGVGAISIIVLGYWRASTPDPQAEVIHMQQIRSAQSQLRQALENASRPESDLAREDVRVRRV